MESHNNSQRYLAGSSFLQKIWALWCTIQSIISMISMYDCTNAHSVRENKILFILNNQINHDLHLGDYIGLQENRGNAKMKIKVIFTPKGKIAIENFTDEELIEIFIRYSNTLRKKYEVDINLPLDENQKVIEDGVIMVTLSNINCDVVAFFKELGRDLKVPLKKRLNGNLDNVFKITTIEA